MEQPQTAAQRPSYLRDRFATVASVASSTSKVIVAIWRIIEHWPW